MIHTDTHTSPQSESRERKRFVSLRAKFVMFFSLILIIACSSLSWYFIETRRAAMTEHLEELGTILLTSTVRNQHFRTAGLVLEDRLTLDQFMQGLMAIDHVLYVVIESTDGRIRDRQSKRSRNASSGATTMNDELLYPGDDLSTSLRNAPLTTPVISKLILSGMQTLVPLEDSSDGLLPFLLRQETVYDFALPVLREFLPKLPVSHFSDDVEEQRTSRSSTTVSPVVGLVRIGITDAHAKQTLLTIIRNVWILTILIIAAGIVGAHLLIARITTPLRNLTVAAQRLTSGPDEPLFLIPSTHDEVGQLTRHFNEMTQSLYDRNQAITANLKTIRQQIRQLATVHQSSAAIASTSLFDMNQLLDTVLRLLVENLGFPRVVVALYYPERQCARIVRMIGVRPEIANEGLAFDIPVVQDGTISADLLIEGKSVLAPDLETLAPRIYPPVLNLLRRAGTRSLAAVPLQSRATNLGYVAVDRETVPCSEEDIHVLLTIAGHVAAAIDNARAYSELAGLTQHLEERIEQRTQELSQANRRLQEHDRRRSTFLSVVSHELRTPMTAIRSFAENMLDGVTGPLTTLQHTYLSRIQHNVARLGRIIVQLLDWSRLDTQKIELQMEPVCIHEIARIAADSLHLVASEKDVRLELATTASLPPVSGDRDKLEQILWNLIGNAIKFTSPGGRVTVESCLTSSGFVQTCIADTGCGIDVQHLSHVFNEFSRVPSAMPGAQGAQLGLCITKTLVTMHHGHIWVESEPEIGSRFYFTLPIAESFQETGCPHHQSDVAP